jgi:hypothetical protein
VSTVGLKIRRESCGIGMTWEHDLQLYFKRAKAFEVAFGDATWHRERARLREPSGTAPEAMMSARTCPGPTDGELGRADPDNLLTERGVNG